MKSSVSIASCSMAVAFCWFGVETRGRYRAGGVVDAEAEEPLRLLNPLMPLPVSLEASKIGGFERRGFRGDMSTGGARDGPLRFDGGGNFGGSSLTCSIKGCNLSDCAEDDELNLIGLGRSVEGMLSLCGDSWLRISEYMKIGRSGLAAILVARGSCVRSLSSEAETGEFCCAANVSTSVIFFDSQPFCTLTMA